MREETRNSQQTTYELNDRYLLVHIDGMLYGTPLSIVTEILPIQNITRIPCVINYIKGIINLRGKIVPVVDVRLKFNLEEAEHTDKTCIVVVNYNGSHVGLIVDSVYEVAPINSDMLSPPPKSNTVANQFISSITELNKNVILNIDFERFFSEDMLI